MEKHSIFRAALMTVCVLTLLSPGRAQSPVAAPGAPVDLRAIIAGKNVRLTWKEPLDHPELVTGYEIERASLASGPFKPVGTVDKGVQAFLDKTAKPEVIYFYRARAIGKEGTSLFSRSASVEISGTR